MSARRVVAPLRRAVAPGAAELGLAVRVPEEHEVVLATDVTPYADERVGVAIDNPCVCSYGLYSYGLNSYGLYSYGLMSE